MTTFDYGMVWHGRGLGLSMSGFLFGILLMRCVMDFHKILDNLTIQDILTCILVFVEYVKYRVWRLVKGKPKLVMMVPVHFLATLIHGIRKNWIVVAIDDIDNPFYTATDRCAVFTCLWEGKSNFPTCKLLQVNFFDLVKVTKNQGKVWLDFVRFNPDKEKV
jgi:hypothetical protein